MNVKLKIDTSDTKNVIVEIIRGDTSVAKFTKSQTFGSQVLLPQIDEILKKNNLKISDIKSIEVNPGPGSFTGTRVGVSVANALGYALGIPVNGKKGKIVLPIYDKSKFDY